MKNFKTYLPVAFQAVLVVLGFLLINAGLANENAIPESKTIDAFDHRPGKRTSHRILDD
jgi:hypothetical protein